MKITARGFTLIELLVVVVLIAVMLAIAVPSFASFISNYRATTAINDFLQGVTQTRIEALKQGRFVDMVPNTGNDWSSGWTIFVDKDLDLAVTPGDEVLGYHGPLPTTITVTNANPSGFPASAGHPYVAYDGSGYPRLHGTSTSLTGGITMVDNLVSPPKEARTICISTFGRPRIIKTPAASVPLTCSAAG